MGYTAKAADATALTLTRNFTTAGKELEGAAAFRESYFVKGDSASVAGGLAHEAAGARGPGEGVDYVRWGAFEQEIKFHQGYQGIDQKVLNWASTDSLNKSIRFQLNNPDRLVRIRSVKHVWVSRTDAVMAVTH